MPFSPTDIPGCQLWLKGDAGVYHDAGITLCTPGQTMLQWNDQSGSGHNTTNVVTPTYMSGISVDGTVPALNFDGAGVTIGSLSISAPYTIFIVYRPHNGSHNDISGNVRYLQGLVTNWLIGPRSGFHANFAGAFVANGSGPAVVEGVIVRAMSINSGSASHFSINGADITQSTSPVTAPAAIGLGAGSTNEPVGGYICEVIIYNSELNTINQTSVDNYLKRWTNAAVVGGPVPAALLPGM